jgi:ubiquinone/menaquinone biosynthesis C-methylase UbiE
VTEHEPISSGEQDPLWRGVDLSGMTVVLGPGGGELVQALAQQAASVGGGCVLAVGYDVDALAQIQPLAQTLPVAAVNARIRQLPLLDDTIDLLVMNGTLRQVPPRHFETMFEEIWRVLAPGGQLRIADILEPSAEPEAQAWRLRNELVLRLGAALERPVANSVNLRDAAAALASIGFEELAVTILPGMPLTEAWLEATHSAIEAMASRVADPQVRRGIVERDLPRLAAAFQRGDQRAAERFVLRGRKIGDLALSMEAAFTEEDLVEDDEDEGP